MFEIPNAKRVKRSDLLQNQANTDEGSSDDNRPQQDANDGTKKETARKPYISAEESSYAFEYEFIDQSNGAVMTSTSDPKDHDQNQSFSFNLFKPKTKNVVSAAAEAGSSAPTALPTSVEISIRSPSPVQQSEAGFVQPIRPLYYFFTSALPKDELSKRRQEFRGIALSGHDIEDRSKSTKWPGTSLPWRVIHVSKNQLIDKVEKRSPKPRKTYAQSSSSRTRPSKKRRILLRKRITFRERQKISKQQDEEAEREKRTRKNREKKVKRKERDKKKKLEALAASETGSAPTEVKPKPASGE